MDIAETAHREAWIQLAERARSDAYARYALYASRKLCVKHPEVYLLGDNWFYEGARTVKGFKEAYEEQSSLAWRHMRYGSEFFDKEVGYEGIPDANPLRFSALKLDKYRISEGHRIYPEPYLPLLDQRLAPLPVSLKPEGKVVTCLELAEIAYFQAKESGANVERLFLILCGNEEAYLLREEELVSARTGGTVSAPNGPPILIFNEQAVWYPLMGRDDRSTSVALRNAVESFATDEDAVPGDEWERSLAEQLREGTALDGTPQFHMAALASVRAKGWRFFRPYADVWREFVPEEDFDTKTGRRLCVVREFDRLANSISCATAYLLGVMGASGSLEERMRRLSHEYLLHTAVVREAEAHGWKPAWRLESWGHLWPCGLMEHTIDDSFRSRTGHCISQAHMVAAVLEMAEIPHVVVNFDRGGVTKGVRHHFILSNDGTFLVDDGIVNFRGVDKPTEDYGPLISFAAEGEWASTVGDKLFGNITSARIGARIAQIEIALAERFDLRFYADEKSKTIVDARAFKEFLKTASAEEFLLP
jgi:hypothetical protein